MLPLQHKPDRSHSSLLWYRRRDGRKRQGHMGSTEATLKYFASVNYGLGSGAGEHEISLAVERAVFVAPKQHALGIRRSEQQFQSSGVLGNFENHI